MTPRTATVDKPVDFLCCTDVIPRDPAVLTHSVAPFRVHTRAILGITWDVPQDRHQVISPLVHNPQDLLPLLPISILRRTGEA